MGGCVYVGFLSCFHRVSWCEFRVIAMTQHDMAIN